MSTLSDVTFTAAIAADGPRIADLLREAGLPSEDFQSHLGHFIVARSGTEIIGAVGAEVYGAEALLRSLVVAPSWRGQQLGDRLFRELEVAAGGWGVQRWWLLTTTAESFFLRRGFHVTPREAAPAAIAGTTEFRGLCPSVAVCLMRERRSA
jgi:amino-acid N-acetyltransferase